MRILVFVVLLVLVACEGRPVEPEPGPEPSIVALRVTPDAALLDPDQSIALDATAYGPTDEVLAAPVEWTSSDPSIATVDGRGKVTAHAPGSVEIVAHAGTLGVSAAIAVHDAATEEPICGTGGRPLALIAQADLVPRVQSRLVRFAGDLCADGYAVRLLRSEFRRAGEVRAWLVRERRRTDGALEGAILVGDLPHAYQWITLHTDNPSIPDESEEAISFQYYADLDGIFRASPTYLSPFGRPHSYDVHEGDLDWEIWIGILPPVAGGLQATADAINDYLDRNHAWRSGGDAPPRAFLQVSEHFVARNADEHALLFQAMRTGPYAWTPFSTADDAHLYFDSPPGGLSTGQGYRALEDGVADFTVLDAHGYYGASGALTIEWARTHPIRTTFFWSNGCAVGDLDHADNFLTAVLYGPASEVLVAKGTTNNSGGLGNNAQGFFGHNVATAMLAGENVGDAIRSHVNVPLLAPWADSREFHFASAVLLGDPTLTLRD